jgi:hypothetical protein
MKIWIPGLVGFIFLLAACGAGKPMESLSADNKALRDNLLAHGFKPDPAGSYVVTLANARLVDAARLLNFSLADLHPTPSQSLDSDIRTLTIGNLYILIYSEVRDSDGRIIADSLDSPEAVCTVRVGFLTGQTVENVKSPKGQ